MASSGTLHHRAAGVCLGLIALLCVSLVSVCRAQESKSLTSATRELIGALSFEAPPVGEMPGGWSGGPSKTVFADGKIFHGGRQSVRIERLTDSSNTFSTVTKSIPINFSGKTIELRGFIRTEGVSDFAGLWLREDGESSGLAFDNMQKRQLKGTTEWAEYSVTLPIHPKAKQLFLGFLVAGTGKAWADDFQLLVDGKPVWEVPTVERPKTALDLDHEFDGGSGIVMNEPTPIQVENLAMLGKVWGFLKYHHPLITSGQRHWDYELFRVLPAIIAAKDRQTANAALVNWIEKLGAIAPCNPCAKLGRVHTNACTCDIVSRWRSRKRNTVALRSVCRASAAM